MGRKIKMENLADKLKNLSGFGRNQMNVGYDLETVCCDFICTPEPSKGKSTMRLHLYDKLMKIIPEKAEFTFFRGFRGGANVLYRDFEYGTKVGTHNILNNIINGN